MSDNKIRSKKILKHPFFLLIFISCGVLGIVAVIFSTYFLHRNHPPKRSMVTLRPYEAKELARLGVADAQETARGVNQRLTALNQRTQKFGYGDGCLHDAEYVPPATSNPYNDFAFDFYREAAKKGEGNLFLATLEVGATLNAMAFGAKGATRQEIFDALHFQSESDALLFGRMVKGIAESTDYPVSEPSNEEAENGWIKDRTVSIKASRVFLGAHTIDWNQERLTAIQKTFGLEPTTVDFAQDPEKVRQTINDSIAETTGGIIAELVAPGDFDAETPAFLTDAARFSGSWLAQFREEETRPRPFTLASEEVIETDAMSYEESFCCAFCEDAWILPYDYIAVNYTMLFLLPPEGKTLADLESILSSANLASWLSQVTRYVHITVQLPKFKFSTQLSLQEPLEALGVKTAFSSSADFSPLCADGKSFSLKTSRHQTFVEIDEKGTVAAAASCWGTRALAEPEDFRVNRPFLFLIYEKSTQTVLFIGRVTDPRSH